MIKNHFQNQGKLLAGKRRTLSTNKSLGRSLAFIAGAINAGGFLVVNQYTSHMTGILSSAADHMALNHWFAVIALLSYIVSFVCGAMVSSLLVLWARYHKLHSQYAIPITIEALLLLIFGVMSITNTLFIPMNIAYIIALLCFLMGLQNAVITKISQTTIRTTHVTAMLTDIGIELGKIFYSYKHPSFIFANKEKICLYLSLVSMFSFGGMIGAYGFKYIGISTVIPLAGYLLFLAYWPIRQDFIIGQYLQRRLQRML